MALVALRSPRRRDGTNSLERFLSISSLASCSSARSHKSTQSFGDYYDEPEVDHFISNWAVLEPLDELNGERIVFPNSVNHSFTIGRLPKSETVDHTLISDSISRFHCTFTMVSDSKCGNMYFVEGHKSKNRIYVSKLCPLLTRTKA